MNQLIYVTYEVAEAALVILNGVIIYHEDDDKDWHQMFSAQEVCERVKEALQLSDYHTVELSTNAVDPEMWDFDMLADAAKTNITA